MPHVRMDSKLDFLPAPSEDSVRRYRRMFGEIQSTQGAAASLVEQFALNVDARNLASLTFRSDALAAAGESMTVDVSRVRGATVTSLLTGAYVYNNGVTVADAEISLDALIDPDVSLQEGDIIRISRVYVPGGGATPVVNTLVRAQFE